MATTYQATARAHSNIALVKYWGKRDARLNLPAVGSLSLSLEALHTDTTVAFDQHLRQDEVVLAGSSDADRRRVSAFLDLIRQRAQTDLRARVSSSNNFPTGAGLASSASGFAALACAATAALGLDCTPRELSVLARQGSGSAARSIFGGLVLMHRGERDDGNDAYAEPLAAPQDWPLAMAIAVVDEQAKATGSTQGMHLTADTSPYYPAWVASASADLSEARGAVAQRDIESLGQVAEHSCLKMHALMLSARPGLLYWRPGTVAAIETVHTLRDEGVPAWFTMDAGPQVKVLTEPDSLERVLGALRRTTGVRDVRGSRVGPGVHFLEQPVETTTP